MVAKHPMQLLALTLATCLMAPAAHAQPAPQTKSTPAAGGAPAPPPADTNAALTGQARKLHQEGMEHIRVGAYKEAYAAFAAAWGIKEHYRIAGPLGACELHLGKHRDAAEHLRFYLDSLPPGSDAADKRKTQEMFLKAATKIVQLTVIVRPAGALVRINGDMVQTGRRSFLAPGEFQIEAEKSGYQNERRTLNLQPGTSHTIELSLTAIEQPPPPPSSPDGRLIAGIATGVGALAGLAVGIGTTAVAAGHAEDKRALDSMDDSACYMVTTGRCAELADAIAAHDTMRDASVGGFVAGGVLAAASAGLLLWWALDDESPADATPTVSLVPAISPTATGLVIMGAW